VAEVELPNPEHLGHQRSQVFTRRVALTTACYAVALAVAAQGSKVAMMKEMLLAQQQSSDQWAFYQAKVIREHQYRGQKMMLELQLAEPSTLKPPRPRQAGGGGQEIRRGREALQRREERYREGRQAARPPPRP